VSEASDPAAVSEASDPAAVSEASDPASVSEEGDSVTDGSSETVVAEGDTGKVKAADINVVKGNPSDDEIAALVAALSALATKSEAEDLTPKNRWAEPVDMLRYTPHSWQRVTLYERAKLARPQGRY
jgi:hypothetical protein